jgi:hypothetical protein
MGEKKNAHSTLVGKPEEMRSIGTSRYKWEDNIKIDLRETGWDAMHWIEVAQDRAKWRAFVNMNIRICKML